MNPTLRFLAALLLTSIPAFPQVAPVPPTSPPAAEKPAERNSDGTLVLSPFEVTANNDVGYIATNSLAGSRLNSALKDTPAIIDVFTKEFLADLGANDLPTAMAYANNSQEDVGDTLRVINGGDTVSAGAAFQFRSRGLPGSRARNYFDTRLPIDLFVVERLDESRGPNSVTLDTESAGYEARITANLSAGLRFILNYSFTNQDKANTYPRTKLLWQQVYAFVNDLQAANPNVNVNALAGSSGSTLGALLATNVTDLADRSFDFEQSLGNRKHKANVFGNYTFQGPRLKGVVVGGGGRYQSAINAGLNNLKQILKGSELLLFDAMARYPVRFSFFDRRIRGSLQINVRNLLNERDPQILRYTGNGLTIDRVNLQTPREVIFSFTAKH